VLLKKAAGLATVKKPGSGSKEPNRNKVGKVSAAELRKLAELKMQDTNCNDVEAVISMMRGTAKSMGIEIVD
jgi:large subunit ribosomal protein L11